MAGFRWLLFLSVPSCVAPGCQHEATFPSAVSQRDTPMREARGLCQLTPASSPALVSTWTRRLQVGGRSGLRFALVAPGVGKMAAGIPKRRAWPRQDAAAWGKKGAALQLGFTPAHRAVADPWSALASRKKLLTLDRCWLVLGKLLLESTRQWKRDRNSPRPPFSSAVGSKAEILGQIHPGRVL